MKTYTTYADIPENNEYLGCEDGNGCMSECLADLIDRAINTVVRLREDDATYSYFEVQS